MKYRKKPVVIEAEQFIEGAHVPEGVYQDEDGRWVIDTLEGTMFATSGDFIIIGVKGEKYPCKPDIFWMTYDKVEV